MKKVLKYGVYSTPEEVTKAINDLIYNRDRDLVQIVSVSDTFFGSSKTKFIVWYNIYVDENDG